MKHFILFGTFFYFLKMIRPDFVDQFRNNLANQIQRQVQSALRGIPMQQQFGPMFQSVGPAVNQRFGGNDHNAESGEIFSPQIGSYSNVDPSNEFQAYVEIGKYTNIGPRNKIDSNTRIGNYVGIGALNKIQRYCRIGNYATIGDRNFIGYNTNFENYANLGFDNNIGEHCNILSYASIQNHVTIGNGVKLCSYSTVLNNVNIKNGSLLDRYSTLNPGARLEQNVYVGRYSSVNAYVPNSVIIYDYVDIPSDASIVPGEVIMRSPSSLQFYQQCAPYQNIPTNYLSNVDVSLKQLIDEMINELKINCRQRDSYKMAIIKSLYLIKFHGLDNFRQYEPQVKFPNELVMGPNCSPAAVLYQKLENESHFGPNATVKDIMAPDLTRKMMQILAIEEDSKRQERLEENEHCKIIEEILSDQRKVTCAKRYPSVYCTF